MVAAVSMLSGSGRRLQGWVTTTPTESAPTASAISAALTSLAVGALVIGVVTTHPWNLRPQPLNIETATTIGNLLLTTYVLPFWIASVLLTVGLVGAIVIAREE